MVILLLTIRGAKVTALAMVWDIEQIAYEFESEPGAIS
jgi:hypothetical protein